MWYVLPIDPLKAWLRRAMVEVRFSGAWWMAIIRLERHLHTYYHIVYFQILYLSMPIIFDMVIASWNSLIESMEYAETGFPATKRIK